MLLRRIKKNVARGVDAQERSLWGDLISLGFVFPIAICLGLFGGRWIGAKVGHQDLGQWVGLGFGIGAAFWELFKTSQKMDRFEAGNQQATKEREGASLNTPLLSEDQDQDDDQP